MEGVETDDIFFLYGTINVNEIADNFVTYVEPLCWKELRAIFALVNLIFSPDSLEGVVLNILSIASGLANVKPIPNVLEFSLTYEKIRNRVWDHSAVLSVYIEEIVDHGNGLKEHNPQHEPDVLVDLSQILIIFSRLALCIYHFHQSLNERGNQLIVYIITLPSLSINQLFVSLVVKYVGIVDVLDVQFLPDPSVTLIGLFLVQYYLGSKLVGVHFLRFFV
jgi:hypothetical protein